MNTFDFSVNANSHCSCSKLRPDQYSINMILQAAKKKQQKQNFVIIARFQWLEKRGLQWPERMNLPNLCLIIKNGKLEKAFYSNTLTHIIKKQNYIIQVLN